MKPYNHDSDRHTVEGVRTRVYMSVLTAGQLM